MYSKDVLITSALTVFAFIFKAAHGFNFESRNLSACWDVGLKCARGLSSCKFDLDRNNLTCFCVAGYTGQTCEEDRNECDIGSASCTKRGVCHNSIGSFRCDCLPGWRGSHCQTSDGSGLSACLTGYTGVNCTDDFDECTQWRKNPCEHGSTCVNTMGNFTCSCMTGWEGRICNEDINECNLTSGLCHNGGNCTNIPGSYKCVCPYPYTGPACDDVSSATSTTTTTTTTTTTPMPITTSTATGVSSTSAAITTTTTTTTLFYDRPETKVALISGSIAGGAVLLCAVLIGIFVYSKCTRESRRETRTN